MQQSPYMFRLSIHSTMPPLTDPRIVLQRVDEVSAAFRMLSDAQTSTLVLTGDPGAGKSTLAALLYRNLEMAAQAGQVPVRHFVWLSLGPNAILPDVIAAILSEMKVADANGVGASNRAGVNPAIHEEFPDFFMRKPEEQIGLLRWTLSRPQECAFVVLDQFEELLDVESPQAM